jgi:hypothetical protein
MQVNKHLENVKRGELTADLGSIERISINGPVRSDVDFLLDNGFTIEILKHHNLISDIEILEKRLTKSDHAFAEYSHLKSMMYSIINRWRLGQLNNKTLDGRIELRIINKIILAYISGDELQLSSEIKKEIDTKIEQCAAQMTDRYLKRQDDNLIKICDNILNDIKYSRLADVNFVYLAEIGAKIVFLDLLKKSEFSAAELAQLQNGLIDQWIADINFENTVGVISLDRYCLKLANELAENRCKLSMALYYKMAFQKIIKQWQEDCLPNEVPQLKEHIEKYLRTYFQEKIYGTNLYWGILSKVIYKQVFNRRSSSREVMHIMFKARALDQITEEFNRKSGVNYYIIVDAIKDLILQHRNAKSEIAVDLIRILAESVNLDLQDYQPGINRNRLFSPARNLNNGVKIASKILDKNAISEEYSTNTIQCKLR